MAPKTQTGSSSDTEKYTRKDWLETQEYQNKKEELLREINSYVMVIDYSVFKHSKEEKEQILNHKYDNLKERQLHYGVGKTNKHLNIPSRQLEAPIHMTF